MVAEGNQAVAYEIAEFRLQFFCPEGTMFWGPTKMRERCGR